MIITGLLWSETTTDEALEEMMRREKPTVEELWAQACREFTVSAVSRRRRFRELLRDNKYPPTTPIPKGKDH